MQIFRYMFLIWDAYEKEAEKLHDGISKQKDFQYPPVLPIVYYEGAAEWTVPRDFISRITNGQDFREYLPDFRYYLVPLNGYSNQDLMAKKDEISLVMMINKMQTLEDIKAFRMLPAEDIEDIVRDSPEHLVNIIADILLTFLLKINVPVSEAENLRDKVREKKVAELFENMEELDIQAERRNTEEQRQRADAAEQRADEAEQKADVAEQKAKNESQRADEAEQKARNESQRANTAIIKLIKIYQNAGMSNNAILQILTNELGMDEEEAASKIEQCKPPRCQ